MKYNEWMFMLLLCHVIRRLMYCRRQWPFSIKLHRNLSKKTVHFYLITNYWFVISAVLHQLIKIEITQPVWRVFDDSYFNFCYMLFRHFSFTSRTSNEPLQRPKHNHLPIVVNLGEAIHLQMIAIIIIKIQSYDDENRCASLFSI